MKYPLALKYLLGFSAYVGCLYCDLIDLIAAFSGLLFLLLTVAAFTLAERKIMGGIQRRRGPNVVGFYGTLQPIADALKLLMKESVVPLRSNEALFNVAPILILTITLTAWAVIPFGFGYVIADPNLGLLFVFAISSINVYGIILAGWASNSKYGFLGALRSVAQMISYEVPLGFVLLTVTIRSGSMNLTDIVIMQKHGINLFPLLPVAICFYIIMLAETNRTPLDLVESEAELVAGYNVEYSGIPFALFFLGEYASMLLMSALFTIMFLGGWWGPVLSGPFMFNVKLILVAFTFIWVRASLPRYRYDQLMDIGWKVLVPITMSYFFFFAAILFSFSALPDTCDITVLHPLYNESSYMTLKYN